MNAALLKVKAVTPLFLVVCFSTVLQAQTLSPDLRLTGIVSLPETKCAVLESPPEGPFRRAGLFILAQGQREGAVEVLDIQPMNGTVKLNLFSKDGQSTLMLTNHIRNTTNGFTGILLHETSLEAVLNLYAEFSKRTLLRSPLLPKESFTLEASAADRAAGAQILKRALAERAIAAIPDGEKFMLVVPQAEAATVTPNSSQIESPGASSSSEMLPAGAINFPDTDIVQVLPIYAELVGRKLDRSTPIVTVSRTIQLKTETLLSRAEAIYALETVLRLAGVKMVPVGDDSIKAVAVPPRSR